nr:uroporphyrinogen decarboxylase family protein [Candidatus Sigynarchaeota archaeon]
MNSKERFLVALNHEEPDRVPLIFTNVMDGFKERWQKRYEDEVNPDDVILFGGHDLTMAKHLGFDAAWSVVPEHFDCAPDPAEFKSRLPVLKASQSISSDGRIHEHGMLAGKNHAWYTGPGLRDPELWLEWFGKFKPAPLPSAAIAGLKRGYAAATSGPNGGFLPLPVISAVFETVVESLGLDEFSRLCRKDMATLEKMLDIVTEHRIVHARDMGRVGIDVAVMGDDSAYKGRPYISPKLHDALIVPRYAKIAAELHRAGAKLLLHSDGFTEPYFPGLVKAGIDGVHTIEKAAGMDLGHLKVTWGDKIALMGPVDCAEVLSYGTPATVEAEIITLLKQGARGGGFAMGPCTALLDTVPLDNVHAMVAATLKYGKYPLARF